MQKEKEIHETAELAMKEETPKSQERFGKPMEMSGNSTTFEPKSPYPQTFKQGLKFTNETNFPKVNFGEDNANILQVNFII